MTLINLRTLLDALPAPLPFGATLSVQRWANGAPATVIDGDAVTFPAKLAMRLDVDADSIDVPATDGRYCIRWVLSVPPAYNVPPVVRHTSIPDVGPVEFADLTDVDPATFAPTRAVVGAWYDAIATVRQLLGQAEDATAAAHEHEEAAGRYADAAAGHAGDAGARASDAAASARAAADSAGDADRSAGEASDSRDGAGRSATDADQSRRLAEAAAALALAGQFAGADLGAEDLDTILTPGVRRQSSQANGTLARNYPKDNSSGVLRVYQNAGTGWVTQEFVRFEGTSPRGMYVRNRVNGVFQPWRFMPTQRVAQTAGRAIYTWDDVNSRDQLIYGDTGWRNIDSLMVNNWALATGGLLRLRRVGWVVFLAIANLSSSGAPTGSVVANGISGFNTSVGWVRFLSAIRQGQAFTHRGSSGLISTDTLAGWTDTGGVRDLFSWHTEDPWPTSLPGTAVGSIPA